MRKVWSILLITAMIAGVALLSACGGQNDGDGGDGGDGVSGAELTEITVSEIRGISWASAYVAQSLGYFEDEGLDVEFVIYKDGPVAFQGMHAGDSQFCMLSAEPVMRAYDEGMESYMIMTNSNNRIYAFAARPEIKSAADLKGKTVFAGMPGSAPYSFVLSLLSEAGLSENDVNFLNMEYGAAIVSLSEGVVDGTFFDIYNKSELLAAVPEANILVDTTDPATHEKLYGSQLCDTTIVTCTKQFADENPETVQAFVNASVKGLKWIGEHSSAEIAELLIPMFEGMTEQQLADKLETIKSSFSATGAITEEGYQTVENFCLEQGLIQKPIGYQNIIPAQFVENALK